MHQLRGTSSARCFGRCQKKDKYIVKTDKSSPKTFVTFIMTYEWYKPKPVTWEE